MCGVNLFPFREAKYSRRSTPLASTQPVIHLLDAQGSSGPCVQTTIWYCTGYIPEWKGSVMVVNHHRMDGNGQVTWEEHEAHQPDESVTFGPKARFEMEIEILLL